MFEVVEPVKENPRPERVDLAHEDSGFWEAPPDDRLTVLFDPNGNDARSRIPTPEPLVFDIGHAVSIEVSLGRSRRAGQSVRELLAFSRAWRLKLRWNSVLGRGRFEPVDVLVPPSVTHLARSVHVSSAGVGDPAHHWCARTERPTRCRSPADRHVPLSAGEVSRGVDHLRTAAQTDLRTDCATPPLPWLSRGRESGASRFGGDQQLPRHGRNGHGQCGVACREAEW